MNPSTPSEHPYCVVPTLVAVITCAARPLHRAAIRQTWWPLVPTDRRFIVGAGVACPDAEDVLCLEDADDSYDGLAQKTWALCRWALDHGYEWVLKCNDDVWLWPRHLSLPTTGTFVGWLQHAGHWIQGHAFWIHRSAMEIVANEPRPYVLPPELLVEDRWVSGVLQAHGVFGVNDPRFACVGRSGAANIRTWKDRTVVASEHLYSAEWSPEELLRLHATVSCAVSLPTVPVRLRAPTGLPYTTVNRPTGGAVIVERDRGAFPAFIARELIDAAICVPECTFTVLGGVSHAAR